MAMNRTGYDHISHREYDTHDANSTREFARALSEDRYGNRFTGMSDRDKEEVFKRNQELNNGRLY